jgi:lipopolysaccharide transport system permease protein
MAVVTLPETTTEEPLRTGAPAADVPRLEETVISSGRAGRQYLTDLWRYRELFLFLAWRDLLVRYKQTVVGVAWSLIRPLLTMLVLTLVFGKLGKMAVGSSVPYPLIVLSGLLPWQFFASAMSDSGNSLLANAGLVSKVYFPRLVIPASTLVTSLVDFLISLAFLAVLMVWYDFMPPVTVLLLPAFLLLAIAAAFGTGLWAAAVTVQYRDFRFIVPFVVQFGLYLSPVGFSSGMVPENLQLLYSLNPMVGIIEGFRWCLLGSSSGLFGPALAISIVESTVLVITGLWYFRKFERSFADVI